MASVAGLQCLRPYLFGGLPVARRPVYVRLYDTARGLATKAGPSSHEQNNAEGREPGNTSAATALGVRSVEAAVGVEGPSSVQDRIRELKAENALVYPRIQRSSSAVTFEEYARRYSSVPEGLKLCDTVTIRGRVIAIRRSSKKLIFMDIIRDGKLLQAVCSLETMGLSENPELLHDFSNLLRRGDIVSVVGSPVGKKSGPMTIKANELPQILTPTLHDLPSKLEDPQTRIRHRHIDLLVNRKSGHMIRLRSHIIQRLRDFLLREGFLEVQTPIVVDKASGAAARPFTTVATELPERQLALRIAPEIWLKRLILGGIDSVFEIGPAFRNEGLDATHNPEFTTCEFYQSFADLEDLMLMTERLISDIAYRVNLLTSTSLKLLPRVDASLSATPFKRIEFIPAIEAAIGEALPDLAAEDATESLLALLTKHDVPVPHPQTVPRMLDKLASVYIEPQCQAPTYIIHHPACMAPLSKSFLDPQTKQLVSARAELFVQKMEIANMYEEENSPFEQRRKLVQQALLKDEETGTELDESYLKALEWGLPPTGGWGCGVDRLCMLFSGSSRISDVLTFGSLRNVVGLGSAGAEKGASERQEGEAEKQDDETAEKQERDV